MAVSARRHGQQELVERLQARREEIEQTLLTRVYAISDPAEVGDPEYALGLRTAVTAALDYALDSLGASEAHRPPLPPELPAQARAAARNGVSLDTVLRRYFAGYTLLADCLMREAEARGGSTQAAMRTQGTLFGDLMDAVTDAYNAEIELQLNRRMQSSHGRRAESVSRLLSGGLIDPEELDYDLSGWHIGLLARGNESGPAVQRLAKNLDYRVLWVPGAGGVIWAWFGDSARPDPDRLRRGVAADRHPGSHFSFGEPGRGLSGWRLTHRQAMVAMPIGKCMSSGIVSYGDVALLAAALQDELLAKSLRQTYLIPLEAERAKGASLCQTLRAYLSSGQKISSAAAALGVSRQTVKKRIELAEEMIGQSIVIRAAEIDTALRLSELNLTPVSDP